MRPVKGRSTRFTVSGLAFVDHYGGGNAYVANYPGGGRINLVRNATGWRAWVVGHDHTVYGPRVGATPGEAVAAARAAHEEG